MTRHDDAVLDAMVPTDEQRAIMDENRDADDRARRRSRLRRAATHLAMIAALTALIVGAFVFMANRVGVSVYVDADGFQRAVAAAGQFAEENPESTNPITAAAILARDAEITGSVQVAGSPADGWCVRAGQHGKNEWAYYDSLIGSLDPEARPAAPESGPCHDADWLTVR